MEDHQLVFTHHQRQLEMYVPSTWEVWAQGKNVVVLGPYKTWKTTWNHLMSFKMNFNYTGEISMELRVGITALTRRNRG